MTTSCVSYDELLYFRKDDTALRQMDSTVLAVNNIEPLKIQQYDIFAITVRSFEQELAAPFNIALDKGISAQVVSPFNTYQVDDMGFIDFPVLGKIHIQGKTISQAKDTIRELLQTYLKSPSINMRLTNFKIAVLGEVNNPGTFSVNSDRITVLDALGLAQDITPYGNVENVLIIREQNGIRSIKEINLQSTDFIRSQFYYLKQGDVVYVEPRKDKKAIVKDNVAKYATLIASTVQAIVAVGTIIILTNR